VVPAYNEAQRIESSLSQITDMVAELRGELVVVDDGSRDDTLEIATRVLAFEPAATVVQLPRNRGKGAAVRAGVEAASGEAIVFMDADLASDLADLRTLLEALQHADVAIGSRTLAGSVTIGGTQGRAIMARMFNAMARPVMRLPIRDTQCGFKAFRADAARKIFTLARSNRFAFDVEVLAIASALDMRVVEVPIRWTAVSGSTVRFPRDPIQMALDLPRIALRCRLGAVRRTEWQSSRPVPAPTWDANQSHIPESGRR